MSLFDIINNFENLKDSLDKGANVNEINRLGENLLHVACCRNAKIEIIQLLLDHGINVNQKDNLGNTFLHYVPFPNIEIVKLALKYGFNVNVKGCLDETPLYSACCVRNIKVIKSLLNYGADPYIKTDGRDCFDISNQDIKEILVTYYELSGGKSTKAAEH